MLPKRVVAQLQHLDQLLGDLLGPQSLTLSDPRDDAVCRRELAQAYVKSAINIPDDLFYEVFFGGDYVWMYSSKDAIARILPAILQRLLPSITADEDGPSSLTSQLDNATVFLTLYSVLHNQGILRRDLPDPIVDAAFESCFECIKRGLIRNWQNTGRHLYLGGEDWFFPHFHSMAAIFPARQIEHLWRWLWTVDSEEAHLERLWFALALSSAGLRAQDGVRLVDTRWLSDHHVGVVLEDSRFWPKETPNSLFSAVPPARIASVLRETISPAGDVTRVERVGLLRSLSNSAIDFSGDTIERRYRAYFQALATNRSEWRTWHECPGIG